MKRITQYSQFSQALFYDLAIVELAAPFEFNEGEKIWPACLYGTDSYQSDLLYAGYGSTRIHWKNSSGEFTFLQDPKLKQQILITEPELNRKLMITRLKKTTTFIGWLTGTIDVYNEHSSICYGDSGGGLLSRGMNEDANRLFLIGVMSAIRLEKVDNGTAVGKLSCFPGSLAMSTPGL